MGNSNEYMNDYMKRRYVERRRRALDLLGGRCVNCGSFEDLEIDHVDRDKKEFDFGKIWSGSLERFDRELLKAQLLCEDCHAFKTSDDIGVAHGGGVSGKRNCRCELCRPLKNEYQKHYK